MVQVTVITVVYNNVNLIESTLTSVLRQTYSNIEYIVIDGGSTDGTLDILKRYENKISLLISEPDNGIYSAMNKGVGVVNGEWVHFLNSGDVFYNDAVISDVFSSESNNISDVIYGDTIVPDARNEKQDIIRAEIANKKKPMSFCHQSVFVKTIQLKNNAFDERYKICADKNLFCKLFLSGVKFQYVNIPISIIQRCGFSNINRLQHLLEANQIYRYYNIRSKMQGLYYVIRAHIEEVIIKIFFNKRNNERQ